VEGLKKEKMHGFFPAIVSRDTIWSDFAVAATAAKTALFPNARQWRALTCPKG